MAIFSEDGTYAGLSGLLADVPGENNPTGSSYAPFLNQSAYDAAFAGPDLSSGGMFDFLGDSKLMSSYAGLGSALASLAALPSQIDFAKTQTKMLKHNLKTAKQEQARRNHNIASFNRPSEY